MYRHQIHLRYSRIKDGKQKMFSFLFPPPPQQAIQPLSNKWKPYAAPLSNIDAVIAGTILLHAPLADEVERECGGVGYAACGVIHSAAS
jgi:hypothetical protein